MRQFIICLLLLSLTFMFPGCKRNPIRRYQIVNIPQYEQLNYEELLTSNNAEIKCNAICNLIDDAYGYAQVLSKGPPEEKPGSDAAENIRKYETARRVYLLITDGLKNKDENIKTACLVFLSEFASGYDKKGELITIISEVNTDDQRTQYEHLNTLIAVCDSHTEVKPDIIEKYLNSDSWFIRSKTCLLLAKTKSGEYHARLIKEYKNADEDYNKLLILQAFGENYGPEVYDLVKNELMKSDSRLLKRQLAVDLKNYADPGAIAQWLVGNQKDLADDVLEEVIEAYSAELEKDKGPVFFKALIASHDVRIMKSLDNELFFENLYKALAAKPEDADLLSIEKSLLESESVGGPLNAYKTRKAREDFVDKVIEREKNNTVRIFMPEFSDLLERFYQKMSTSLIDAGLNENEMEKFTKEYNEFVSEMKKSVEKPEEGSWIFIPDDEKTGQAQ